MSEEYEKKSIKDGEAGFIFAMQYASDILKQSMLLLGMNVLQEI
jgi:hypothetical protein